MGCLFEFLGEFLLEVFLEGSITLLGYMFPSVSESEKKQKALKIVVTTIACILVFAMFLGAIMLLGSDSIIEHNVGLLLVLAPACIIVLYVIFCIISNVVIKNKKE